MEITGRITADAEVRKINGDKEVVSFTLVVNDYYKTKDGERKEVCEFFTCSYWLGSKVADSLLKGAVVTASGRVYLNEYTDKDGKSRASLGFHANGIKIIATAKKNPPQQQLKETPVSTTETIDDLPF